MNTIYMYSMIPVKMLPQYLRDDTLTEVASDERESVYSYKCGCDAVRQIDADECQVHWCQVHRQSDQFSH